MRDIFPGNGEMATLCRGHDWASTPLGPPDAWPLSLKTTVSTLLTSRHPMFLFWGPEHIQLYNDAYRPSLGETGRHPEGLGARGREFWDDIWDTIGPQIEQVMESGEATWHENQFLPIYRNGELEDAYWTYSYSPVRGDDGSIAGVLVVGQETTSQVRAETNARELAQRLSTTLESITDAFFTLDRAWRFTFLNSEAERVLERNRDELLDHVVWDEFPEAVGSTFHTEYHRAIEQDTAVSFEEFYPPLDRWFNVHAYPSEEGLAVYFQDVTARRRTERRLEERERMLGVTGRMARIGGWLVDLEAGSIHWSDEVCAIHGMPPGTTPTFDEAFGYYPPEWRETIEAHFARCAGEGVPFDDNLQIVTAQGSKVWVRAIGEAIRDEGGRIRAVQGAFQDIQSQKEAEEALVESDRRFRQVAESMPLTVWSADPSGDIDYETRRIRDYTGVSEEDLAGTGWFSVIHPDDHEHTEKAWAQSVETGEPYQVEFRIRREDGAWRWHLTQALPFRDRDGAIMKWYGSSIDIHDQLELKRQAEALASRLTTTLESITDAFYLLDPEWRFAFVNAEAERVLERDRTDILGQVKWEAFPGRVGSQLEKEYRTAMAQGTSAAFRYFDPPLDRWFDIRAYPSSEGLAVYFRDVTTERLAELRLREQAELLDKAQDAILVRTLDHTLLFWNASAERMYGWSRDEALGRSVRELLYEDPAPFEAATAAVLADGEWTGELEHVRKDGSVITVEGRWSLVRDDEGTPYRILAINTDVTERKKLLAQFLRAQRMESIGTLAGGIAHDLNNVLAPILLSIGLLKDEIDDPELIETLSTIESSAERGADMVKQVLGFARGLDRSDMPVDLERTVRDLGRVVRDTFPKSISLSTKVPDDLWGLRGDPTQIHQVLMNLFVNARDAMPDGGRLTVTAENVTLDDHYASMSTDASPGRYVRVSVTDKGSGMPPEIVAQMFDPFFTTKAVGHGTGLGLSTVSAIVKSHGGFINVYSEVGSGTTFRIYLPVGERGDRAEERAQKVPAAEPPRGNGELILVVDDEGSIRDITRQTLEAFGYRVVTATDGADAVAIYGRLGEEIDLVLTDMVMPIMDGPATIRTLRRMDSSIRVIGASGLGASGQVARALDSGVEHFLPKPYTAESLLTMIHRLLQGE